VIDRWANRASSLAHRQAPTRLPGSPASQDSPVEPDVADDDGDGLVDEDPPGDALDDPGENQLDCNEEILGT
jgi:hypothetical protein